ncbi:MAG: hypothetical protein JXM70_09180 [Pirellulales bacterium]|nr:hypothetical protein [Pirellulales bacterium]
MVSSKIQFALTLLSEAYYYAQDVGGDIWNFAVEIETLREVGLTPNDFRWLVAKGYTEPGCEKTETCDCQRRMSVCQGRSFNKRTCKRRACFILTEAGLAFAREVAKQISIGEPPAQPPSDDKNNGRIPLPPPHWDGELRELHVNGQLIKRYKTPAPNQQAILEAFEEEGWPPHIYDPLTVNPSQEQPPKRRLNDSVKGLNSHQKNRLIHFSTDGTGEGVRWEWINNG